MQDAVHNNSQSAVGAKLLQIIERLERLEAEKREVSEQRTAVMAEAKADGYDIKAIKAIVALRKRNADDIAEEEAVIEMYKSALGM